MSEFDPYYLYLSKDFTAREQGLLPTNRRVVEQLAFGTIYAIPKDTTMHMDLMGKLRLTKEEVYADAAEDGNRP